jgi:hypothetical protein
MSDKIKNDAKAKFRNAEDKASEWKHDTKEGLNTENYDSSKEKKSVTDHANDAYQSFIDALNSIKNDMIEESGSVKEDIKEDLTEFNDWVGAKITDLKDWLSDDHNDL